ncbi:MAG: sensor histidine kinase [Solirubrobacterales bacterium]|nr:sensor histidine kinase [Solirubrobacterales bacterium]
MSIESGVPGALDETRLRRLLGAGRALVANLDLEAVLDGLLETAREMTGARYAALGILDDTRATLERFVTRGIDPDTHRAIGDLPSGRGVLGVLIAEPHALRLDDVTEHPLSYGFPPQHPPMHTFLGVPVVIRGEVWGNLYLTEKTAGEPFDAGDEQIAVILAEWAAIAIANARLYEGVQQRRQELERAVRRLEATTAIARAVSGETELPRVLELIVKRGRALLDSRAVVLLLVDGDDFVIAANAGEVQASARGGRFPIRDSTSGDVLRSTHPRRIDDTAQLRVSADRLGVADAHTALIAPLSFRGLPVGVLAAFDAVSGAPFTAEDERLVLGLAASAATAVGTAQTVERDRLRRSLEAAEQERRRWARELHDETLQGLAGLKMRLAGVLHSEELGVVAAAVRETVEQIDHQIDGLRTLITELRPAALDELGLAPAIETLTARMAEVNGFEAKREVALGDGRRLSAELETTGYRIVQEALTNVAKHAGAKHVNVVVGLAGDELVVEVTDDGRGFGVESPTEGFGLSGMRERVALAGGTLSVDSTDAGTRVAARLPVVVAER